MNVVGRVVVARRGSGASACSVMTERSCDPPYSIRESAGRILVVGSSVAPVGGDELGFDVTVERDARADIGTVGAMVVWPGPCGEASSLTNTVMVADGGHLDWHAEPTVSVVGSTHQTQTVVSLASTATCRIVEELVLGRTGEEPGTITLVLRAERGGRTLVHHAERFGAHVPGAGSTVSVGAARHVLSALVVGPAAAAARTCIGDRARAAWLPVDVDAAVVLAVGDDRLSTLAAVRQVAPDFDW